MFPKYQDDTADMELLHLCPHDQYLCLSEHTEVGFAQCIKCFAQHTLVFPQTITAKNDQKRSFVFRATLSFLVCLRPITAG